MELGRHIRYYKTTACQNCPLKGRCTQNTQGRRITRWLDEGILAEMAERLANHPEYRLERSSFVEHPFGTLKPGMNPGYFLLNGLQKVKGEFSLRALAYTMKRVLHLLGVEPLLKTLSSTTNLVAQ